MVKHDADYMLTTFGNAKKIHNKHEFKRTVLSYFSQSDGALGCTALLRCIIWLKEIFASIPLTYHLEIN